MAISMELVNLELMFRRLKHSPLIINDIMSSTEQDKAKLRQLIQTRYDSDLLNSVPSCECGKLVGEYSTGVTCPECNTKVKRPFADDLEPLIWVRSPEGVAPLINPMIWIMLTEYFTVSSFSIIQWLADRMYKPSVKIPKIVEELIESGFGQQRGYNQFVADFDNIMEFLFNHKKLNGKNRDNGLYELIRVKRDCIFSSHIPLPNPTMIVIEETNVGTYVDPNMVDALDAIQTIASIDTAAVSYPVHVRENRTIKTIVGLTRFYRTFFKESLGKKHGIFRQHTFGTRAFFSFRAVVTSSTEPHEYDEIHIPWGIGISVFRYHLINKLMNKHGYSLNDSCALLNEKARVYDPLLDKLFEEIIAESPTRGVLTTINRNPSLGRGSIQLVRITKVKKDPKIPTVSFSILIVTPMNAD